MSKPINVLMVEDSETDALLLIDEMKRGGYDPSFLRVETSEDMLSAIRHRRWDVVVSDYRMPKFSGSDALKLFTGLKLDIPFIMVSGTLGEEAAVKMMKAGANDYILKDNLSRLVTTVAREIEAARLRREAIRAEAAMHHLAAIVQSSEDAIYGKNLDGVITSWNPATERIYGYRAVEIVGKSISVLFPPSRHNELLMTLEQVRRGEFFGTCESEHLCKDGRVITVSLTASPIKNSEAEIIGA